MTYSTARTTGRRSFLSKRTIRRPHTSWKIVFRNGFHGKHTKVAWTGNAWCDIPISAIPCPGPPYSRVRATNDRTFDLFAWSFLAAAPQPFSIWLSPDVPTAGPSPCDLPADELARTRFLAYASAAYHVTTFKLCRCCSRSKRGWTSICFFGCIALCPACL